MYMIPIPIQTELARNARKMPDRFLRSFFHRSGEIGQVTIMRDLAVDGKDSWCNFLCARLKEQVPAIRRNAAWSLGWLAAPSAKVQLLHQAALERCDTARFQMALAARRCGADAEECFSILEESATRRMNGAYGSRITGGLAGWGVGESRDLWALMQADVSCLVAPHQQRAAVRARIEANGDDRESVIALGLIGHPGDVSLLQNMWPSAGRRMRLALCKAMGLHGAPSFIGRLVDCMRSMDVDPGHGFALRMECAVALGRLGFSNNRGVLVQALKNEALDFEGRPGAGMGVQHSVRSHILAALGELQTAPEHLCQYLGNTHGSADGGFYLPAMDALWKCGDPTPLKRLMNQSDLVAANALGVILAISGPDGVRPWQDDPRSMVAKVANCGSV